MKKRLILTMIVLVLALVLVAGRPTPYPGPGQQELGEAYPTPEPPFEPVIPAADCADPDLPCAWGLYFQRWWVSVPGPFRPEPVGTYCVASSQGQQWCFPVRIYNYVNGMNNYRSGYFKVCGTFHTVLVLIDGVYAQIRQPDLYVQSCLHLPAIRAWWAVDWVW